MKQEAASTSSRPVISTPFKNEPQSISTSFTLSGSDLSPKTSSLDTTKSLTNSPFNVGMTTSPLQRAGVQFHKATTNLRAVGASAIEMKNAVSLPQEVSNPAQSNVLPLQTMNLTVASSTSE